MSLLFTQVAMPLSAVCDDSSSYMLTLSRAAREQFSLVCTFWVLGISQGMQYEDQFRPLPHPSPQLAEAQRKDAKSYADTMASLGIFPELTVPDGNVCVPAARQTNKPNLWCLLT